jgi:hypothetical protein
MKKREKFKGEMREILTPTVQNGFSDDILWIAFHVWLSVPYEDLIIIAVGGKLIWIMEAECN